jgi:sigma-E factor negative regulatory protein RseB
MIDRCWAMVTLRFPVVCLLLLIFPALNGLAADDPRVWLQRMGDAVENLNYRGTLVHVNNGTAGVLQIVHRVHQAQVTERITALDGAPREIIRNNDEVTCILPDQAMVMVEHRDDRDPQKSPLRGRLPNVASFNEDHYRLEFVGSGRAAGRDAQIIAVRPIDGYRYGYQIWLDRLTAMPLKSQLWDDHGNVVEEILFAEIRMTGEIPAAAVRASLPTDAYSWHRSGDPPNSATSRSAWRAEDMPPGFELIAALSKMPPGSRQAMEHLVYTDGLASVSVFIEAGVAASEQAEGLSQMGAANAYTTTREGQLVTAVGEVPARSVEMIALSVRAPEGR